MKIYMYENFPLYGIWYIVNSLPPEVTTDVRDFILKALTTNPFNTIKAKVIDCADASEQ